jgi:hypothetical protein
LVAPLTVPWITIHYGWRWAFLITGVLGFGWVLLWHIFYRSSEKSLTQEVVGLILQRTGSYYAIFAIAAGTYLLAIGLIHLIVPRLEHAS